MTMEGTSELLELIYSTACGDQPVDTALSNLNALLDVDWSALVLPEGGPGNVHCLGAAGIDPASWNRWEHECSLSRHLLGQSLYTADIGAVCVRADLDGLESATGPIHDFIEDHRLAASTALVLDNSQAHPCVLYLGFPSGKSAFTKKSAEVLRWLGKHLVRALAVARAISREAAARRLQSATLRLLPYPTVMLDNAGVVVHANNLAAEHLTGDGLAITAAGLRAEFDADQARLTTAIRQLAAEPAGEREAETGIDLLLNRRSGRAPLHVLCARVGVPTNGLGVPGAAVVVVAHDPEAPGAIEIPRMRRLFGFTVAEANVARGVMQGKSLQQIAEESGTSVVTSRNLLKRVFAKSGARRQSELATMLLRSTLTIPT